MYKIMDSLYIQNKGVLYSLSGGIEEMSPDKKRFYKKTGLIKKNEHNTNVDIIDYHKDLNPEDKYHHYVVIYKIKNTDQELRAIIKVNNKKQWEIPDYLPIELFASLDNVHNCFNPRYIHLAYNKLIIQINRVERVISYGSIQ